MALPPLLVPVVGLFTGRSGKAMLIVGAIIGLGFLVYKYNDAIRTAAYNAIFQQQVEDHLKQRDDAFKTLQETIEKQNGMILELQRRNNDLSRRTDQLQSRIKEGISSGRLKDQHVGPILEETIDGIKEIERAEEAAAPKRKEEVKKTTNSVIEAWKKRVQ